MLKQADLQWFTPVDGNGQADNTPGLPINVVAAVNSKELPTVTLDDAGKFFARERPHTAISNTRASPFSSRGSMLTDRQPSIAS